MTCIHGIVARKCSNVFERSPASTVRLCFVHYFEANDASGSHLQGGASLDRAAKASHVVRFAVCTNCQKDDAARLNFCWKYGARAGRSIPVPRYTEQLPVVAMMEGSPGKVQKRAFAHQLEVFGFDVTAGFRGWLPTAAGPVVYSGCSRWEKPVRWCMNYLSPA